MPKLAPQPAIWTQPNSVRPNALCTTHRLRGDTVVTGHVALGGPPAHATERAVGRTMGGPSLRGW